MSNDLHSLGMKFDKWQDAVEAAISTNKLSVIGEVRGGQLIQYADSSGAQINILAVDPFATFAGFDSVAQSFAHVQMLNDVVALCEIVDYNGNPITTVTCNLAQGPLLVDEPEQRWQQIGLTVLANSVQHFPSEEEYLSANGADSLGVATSAGAQSLGDGSKAPTAAIDVAARVLEAEYRTNGLTGDRYIHATVDGDFAFDVCLPDSIALPEKGSVLKVDGVMAGSLIAPTGCGGAGGCGCGSGGCGGH